MATKSEIRKIMEGVVDFYSATRQAGHTTLMRSGTANEECFVVVHAATAMRDVPAPNIAVPIFKFSNGDLRGTLKIPMAWDNAAIHILCQRALDEYDALEVVPNDLRAKIGQLEQKLYESEKSLREMRAKLEVAEARAKLEAAEVELARAGNQ